MANKKASTRSSSSRQTRSVSSEQAKKNSRVSRKKPTPQAAPKVSPKKEEKRFSFGDFLVGRKEPLRSHPMPNEPFMRFAPFFSALAIILALLIAFALGSVHTGVCKVLYKPNIGTFKYLTISVPKSENDFSDIWLQQGPKPQDPSKLKQEKDLFLIDAQGQSYKVLYNSNINPSQLDGRTAIEYGAMDPCNHTVTLDTMQNVIIIPVAGQQSSTPQPTSTQ